MAWCAGSLSFVKKQRSRVTWHKHAHLDIAWHMRHIHTWRTRTIHYTCLSNSSTPRKYRNCWKYLKDYAFVSTNKVSKIHVRSTIKFCCSTLSRYELPNVKMVCVRVCLNDFVHTFNINCQHFADWFWARRYKLLHVWFVFHSCTCMYFTHRSADVPPETIHLFLESTPSSLAHVPPESTPFSLADSPPEQHRLGSILSWTTEASSGSDSLRSTTFCSLYPGAQYMFSSKKCGKADCNICTPVRLPSSVFEQIHFIPDPVPDSGKEHYLPFSELYGTQTTEKHRPSPQEKSTSGSHGIPFNPTSQHACKVSNALTVANSGWSMLLGSWSMMRWKE